MHKIILIDDDKERMYNRYQASYLLTTEYEQLIKVVHTFSSDLTESIHQYDLVLIHQSITSKNESSGAVDDFIDDLEQKNIPLVIFSNGANFDTKIENKKLEIRSDYLYPNLKNFLDSYRETSEINLELLAYGKKYLLEQALRLQTELLSISFPYQKELYLSSSDNKPFIKLLKIAQKTEKDITTIFDRIEDEEWTVKQFKDYLNNIIEEIRFIYE